MATKKTKSELTARNREIQNTLADIYEDAQTHKRELTEEEKESIRTLTREFDNNRRELSLLSSEEELTRSRENDNANSRLRELIRECRDRKRETITLSPVASTNNNITSSGAIELHINELIDTTPEGLALPSGVSLVAGVTGTSLWPVCTNDVEVEEVGENVELNEQALAFDNLKASPSRVGLNIPVSNAAIDNVAFDLLAFVSSKIQKALRKFFATKIYSHAAFTGIKGPYSGLVAKTITLGEDAYKNILKAVAEFRNKGLDGAVCITIDATTEAELKATPMVKGEGSGFVIQNGKLAGYDYTVSHYVNTKLGTSGKLETEAEHYIAIGIYDYLAVQQHGEIRLNIDAHSNAVVRRNITAINYQTEYSITDISKLLNGAKNVTQAFALYKVSAV